MFGHLYVLFLSILKFGHVYVYHLFRLKKELGRREKISRSRRLVLCFLSKLTSESEILFFFYLLHCFTLVSAFYHSINYSPLYDHYSYFDNCSFNPVDSFIWFELYGTPSDRDVDLIGSVRKLSSQMLLQNVESYCDDSMILPFLSFDHEFVNRLYRHGMLWGGWALSIHPTCRFIHHPLLFSC